MVLGEMADAVRRRDRARMAWRRRMIHRAFLAGTVATVALVQAAEALFF